MGARMGLLVLKQGETGISLRCDTMRSCSSFSKNLGKKIETTIQETVLEGE
jgi:hypothetical protein